MSNTDKLLRALIDALGFKVESGDINAGDLIDNSRSSGVYSTKEINQLYPNKHIVTEHFGGNWIVSEPSIDYKVTKKKPQVCFDVDSPEWNAIVTFVLNQADDIEHGIEGYGDLKPMLDYFNRNCINETKL